MEDLVFDGNDWVHVDDYFQFCELSYSSFEDEVIAKLDIESITQKVSSEFSSIRVPRFKTWVKLGGDFKEYSQAYPELSYTRKSQDNQDFKKKLRRKKYLFKRVPKPTRI